MLIKIDKIAETVVSAPCDKNSVPFPVFPFIETPQHIVAQSSFQKSVITDGEATFFILHETPDLSVIIQNDKNLLYRLYEISSMCNTGFRPLYELRNPDVRHDYF